MEGMKSNLDNRDSLVREEHSQLYSGFCSTISFSVMYQIASKMHIRLALLIMILKDSIRIEKSWWMIDSC
jgi:hypothetical protein